MTINTKRQPGTHVCTVCMYACTRSINTSQPCSNASSILFISCQDEYITHVQHHHLRPRESVCALVEHMSCSESAPCPPPPLRPARPLRALVLSPRLHLWRPASSHWRRCVRWHSLKAPLPGLPVLGAGRVLVCFQLLNGRPDQHAVHHRLALSARAPTPTPSSPPAPTNHQCHAWAFLHMCLPLIHAVPRY